MGKPANVSFKAYLRKEEKTFPILGIRKELESFFKKKGKGQICITL